MTTSVASRDKSVSTTKLLVCSLPVHLSRPVDPTRVTTARNEAVPHRSSAITTPGIASPRQKSAVKLLNVAKALFASWEDASRILVRQHVVRKASNATTAYVRRLVTVRMASANVEREIVQSCVVASAALTADACLIKIRAL